MRLITMANPVDVERLWKAKVCVALVRCLHADYVPTYHWLSPLSSVWKPFPHGALGNPFTR